MFRLSNQLRKLEDKSEQIYKEHKKDIPKVILLSIGILYLYGMAIRTITVGIQSVWQHCNEKFISFNPFKNIGAIFSKPGIAITLFGLIMYCLFTIKGFGLISGYKTVKDKKRGIEILPEGTHGTSGFMSKKEMPEFLDVGTLKKLDETLFGRLDNGGYVGMKEMAEKYPEDFI
ncbi:MAG: hypothetical protein MJ210_04100, partial [Alphaproteobacteria bacterium]|nr:hypothetical protein [Alphaproteobacteria bacterium]